MATEIRFVLFFFVSLIIAPLAVADVCPFYATGDIFVAREANASLTLRGGATLEVYAAHRQHAFGDESPVEDVVDLTVHYDDGTFSGGGLFTLHPKAFADGNTTRTLNTSVTLELSDASGVTRKIALTFTNLRWVLGDATTSQNVGGNMDPVHGTETASVFGGTLYTATVSGTVAIDKKGWRYSVDSANGQDTRFQIFSSTCAGGGGGQKG